MASNFRTQNLRSWSTFLSPFAAIFEIMIFILIYIHNILIYFSASLAIVTEPPAFTTPLSDVTTQLGTTSSFETVVIGTPRPEVQWFRDGDELKKGKRVLFEEEANPEGGFKYRVTIRDIVMKDFGQVMFNFRKLILKF